MKHFLIVVDMQKDFVDGALGSEDAKAIVPAAVHTIERFEGEIFATLDTHFENYLETAEGKKLPVPHCLFGSEGWALDKRIAAALEKKGYTAVKKSAFAATALPALLKEAAGDEPFDVLLIGLCTDICVISNALYLKANFPEYDIFVDAACCAGVSEKTHAAALDTMRCCQIDILHNDAGEA